MAALRTGAGLVDVVVTAMTSTTALACDAEDTWQQLLEGGSGIRPLDKWFTREYDSPVRIGGPLREDFDEHLNRVELRRLSYLGKMATVLGRRLWDEAGAPEVDNNRLTVSIGLALGTTEEIAVQYGDWEKRGLRAMSPLAVQMFMPNAPAAAVGLERQAKAGVITPVMGDASGAGAIAEGWRRLVLGEADIAICGAVETWVEAVPVAAFAGLGLLSTNNDDPPGACRPFDRHRDGMVLAEGGALMLIETRSTPRREAPRSSPGSWESRPTPTAMTTCAPTRPGNAPPTRSPAPSSWPGCNPATSTTSTLTLPAPHSGIRLRHRRFGGRCPATPPRCTHPKRHSDIRSGPPARSRRY